MQIEVKSEEEITIKYETPLENGPNICIKNENESLNSSTSETKIKAEPTETAPVEETCQTEIKSELSLGISSELIKDEAIAEDVINEDELNELNDDLTVVENESTAYKCQICEKVMVKYKEYKVHKKNHFIEKRRCHICKKVLKSLGVLEEHVNKHLGLKPYKCEECNKCFVSKNHLSLHKKCHSTDKTYKCKRCEKLFKTRSCLRSHQLVHSERVVEDFKCKVCGHSSPNDVDHKAHMADHAKKAEIQCGLCKKTFNTERGLENHFSTHKELKFPCEFCGKIYPSMYRIKRHIKRAHVPNKCEECNEVFHDRFLFNKHIKQHSQQTKFECEYCQKVFDKAKNLSEHFRLQHKQDGEKKKCHLCDKEFINNALLNKHIKSHDKCFKCKICQKVFSTRYNLEVHSITHSGAKNFKCQICNKNFGSKTGLKSHETTHSEERKFQCEVCAKTFKTTRRLYTHSLCHATEEKYECSICLQKFRVKQYLKAHMYRHSKVKPFSCDVCKKRFKHKKTKEKHMKRGKHKLLTEEEHDCDFCDETFTNRDLLLDHFAEVHHQENVLNEMEEKDAEMADDENGEGSSDKSDQNADNAD